MPFRPRAASNVDGSAEPACMRRLFASLSRDSVPFVRLIRYRIAGAVQPKLREIDAIDSPLSYRATIVGRSEKDIFPRVVAPFIDVKASVTV